MLNESAMVMMMAMRAFSNNSIGTKGLKIKMNVNSTSKDDEKAD